MKSMAMMFGLVIAVFSASSFSAFAAERVTNQELIIGHIFANQKVAASAPSVADAAEKLNAADSNFSSLAVVGVNPKEFGIYFYYKKNAKCKTEEDLEKFLKVQGYQNWSFSDNVIIVK